MRRALQDVVMGLHSGIPPCCVLAYLWLGLVAPLHRAMHADRLWGAEPRDVNYVRCPLCRRLDRRVRLHHCSAECGWLDRFGFGQFLAMVARTPHRRGARSRAV